MGWCTKMQIRFKFDDSLISYFFMKSYVVGTHYNHIVDKILVCYHSNSFYGEIIKEFMDVIPIGK